MYTCHVSAPKLLFIYRLKLEFDCQFRLKSKSEFFSMICFVTQIFVVVVWSLLLLPPSSLSPWLLAVNKSKCCWRPVSNQHLKWLSVFFSLRFLILTVDYAWLYRIIQWLQIHINSVFNMLSYFLSIVRSFVRVPFEFIFAYLLPVNVTLIAWIKLTATSILFDRNLHSEMHQFLIGIYFKLAN